MATFEIHGGNELKGELIPQGAKNEALQVLCAVLMTDEKVTISNLPDIIDVNKLINLLNLLYSFTLYINRQFFFANMFLKSIEKS